MLPPYGRQIVEALRECALFLVRAALLLVRRSHGQDGRDRAAKARSGRMPGRPLMGVLLVSLLLVLHAAPGGSAGGLALSGFGACAEPALAFFASCGRFDPAPSAASMAAARAGSAELDAAMAEALVDSSIGLVGTALAIRRVRRRAPAARARPSARPMTPRRRSMWPMSTTASRSPRRPVRPSTDRWRAIATCRRRPWPARRRGRRRAHRGHRAQRAQRAPRRTRWRRCARSRRRTRCRPRALAIARAGASAGSCRSVCSENR
ncbi:MAG: hypothetical protein QM674_04610 [Burkholderiaceae bacterium]